jgi:phage-related protein
VTITELLIKFGIDPTGARTGAAAVNREIKGIEGQASTSMTKASGHFDEGTKHVGLMHSAVGKLGGAFSVMGGMMMAGGVNEIVNIGKHAVEITAQEDAINKQTQAVIKSTGGLANVSAGQVDNLAMSMMKLTGIDDETIKKSENMLLTFTNIKNVVGNGNDVFDQATKTVTDMSVALGEDGKSAAIQLGKALNDPITGMTALKRVGVSFTEDQKKQVAAMVKSGDLLGAQKLILKELGTEFGGSAKAFGDSSAGAMAKIKNSVDESEKAFVRLAMPIAEAGLQLLPPLIDGVGNLAGKVGGVLAPIVKNIGDILPRVLKDAQDGFQKVSDVVGPVVDWLGKSLPGAVKGLEDAITPLINAAVGPLSAALNDIVSNKDTLTGALMVVGTVVSALVVPPFLAWAAATLAATWPIIAVGAAVAALIVILDKTGVLNWLGKNVMPMVSKAFDFFSKTVLPSLRAQFDWITKNVIPPLGAAFGWIVKNVLPPLEEIGKRVFKAFSDAISFAVNIAKTEFDILKSAFGVVGTVFDGIKTGIGKVWDGIVGIIKGGVNGVIGFINILIGALDAIQLHVHFKIPEVDAGPLGKFGGQAIGFDWNGFGIDKIPALASGGPINGPSVVGENGPEIYWPKSAGTIIPNHQAFGGETHYHTHVDVQGLIRAESPIDISRAAQRVATMGPLAASMNKKTVMETA